MSKTNDVLYSELYLTYVCEFARVCVCVCILISSTVICQTSVYNKIKQIKKPQHLK